jgi:isoamylase
MPTAPFAVWRRLGAISSSKKRALHDLVSYNHKRNDANGEEDQDGTTDNRSWNCGVEGPTDMLAINALRGRLKRSLLATLLLSQGTPMLLAGDELGRTQQGNNNAYCQDNEISWFDWENVDSGLANFTARLIGLRAKYPQLTRSRWLTGRQTPTGAYDILWLGDDGCEMTEAEWEEPGSHAFGFLLGPDGPNTPTLLMLMNAEAGEAQFTLPPGIWRQVLDTALEGEPAPEPLSGVFTLKARSMAVFEQAASP